MVAVWGLRSAGGTVRSGVKVERLDGGWRDLQLLRRLEGMGIVFAKR